ncbi:hypothetical protein ATJ97_3587 [Georgenia soli]|uniref:Uncharacterized protein n=1 Tax=Georgenia soli TaxID=638953 RepID=A0A2A9ER85_9MICO|nr:DUF6069 family protein [Georgenia soli]PFG41041.1 hypothetical protein ATJ97_3587 [Georgenia soli]
MTTSTVHARTSPQADHRPGRYAWLTAISIAAATAANLGLYAVGRWTDATLLVDPGAGAPNHLVIPGDVAWKTAVPLAVGALVLALVARRSRRWVTVLTVAGVTLAAVSMPFVFMNAHDAVTGALLTSMHALTALAYVVIGTRAREAAAA